MAIPDEGINFTSVVSQLERELITRCLEKTGGNKRQAARLLNLSRTTLIDKLHRLNIARRDGAGRELSRCPTDVGLPQGHRGRTLRGRLADSPYIDTLASGNSITNVAPGAFDDSHRLPPCACTSDWLTGRPRPTARSELRVVKNGSKIRVRIVRRDTRARYLPRALE